MPLRSSRASTRSWVRWIDEGRAAGAPDAEGRSRAPWGRIKMSYFNEANRVRAREIVARYPRPKSAILPLAHLAQDQDGWLTKEAMEEIAALTSVTPAVVQ